MDEQKLKILSKINESSNSNQQETSINLSSFLSITHQETVGLLKSLEMSNMIRLVQNEKKYIKLTQDGKEILDDGSPEIIYINYLKSVGGQAKKQDITGKISKSAEERGFSYAMKQKMIKYDKVNNTVSLVDASSSSLIDDLQLKLMKIKKEDYSVDALKQEEIQNLVKSKAVSIETIKFYLVEKGDKFSLSIEKPETDLNKDLISSDDYKHKAFKAYNYKTKGLDVANGSLHPLLKVRSQFREIMLELGFQEMPTNNYIESSFWNFDTLFQPQQHPARDAHDTFFLYNPSSSKGLKEKYNEYVDRVKEVHEKGGYGSLGWRYSFSEEETMKNILRTHTTAVSSRMLYKLAEEYKKEGKFTPKKFFSIDRVFRNETLDSTHLCEFHQIEGVVADVNLGLGHLIGTIELFFKKFGIQKLRFKPAYNPYTEPSMEIFAYHEKHKKWVEIGNSGIFRPEMLLPMGLPSDVSVIAWGLSLERPTMIHYALSSIKDLFGEEVQLRETKNSSIYCINL